MTRRTFKDYRINDFWWGLNLRESPNVIEKKQAQICENWNFEWNKIVNSKRMRSIYNLWGTTPIQGIREFEGNLFFVHAGRLYKDWVEIVITTWGLIPDKKVHISIWWDQYFFTFEDGTTDPYHLDGDTSTLSAIAWVGEPKYNVVYNGKLVLWGYGNDNIYFSKTATPSTKADIIDFSAYSGGNQSVGGNSTGEITWMSIGENWLTVFKYDEVLYSNTEKDTWTVFNFIFNTITTTWALAQNAITEIGQETIYYDGKSKSVRRLSYEQNQNTLRDTSISDEIEPIFHTLSADQSNATASYLYPNYKLFLRSEFAWTNYNDTCLTYNVHNKSWGTETGKACYVSHNGYLWSTFEGKVWKDDELPWKEWTFLWKQIDAGDAIDMKRYGQIEISWKLQSTLTLYADIYIEGALEDTITITVDENVSGTLGTRTLGTSVLASGSTREQLISFRERRDLWFEGRYIEVAFRYEWLWNVEISQENIQWKLLRAYEWYA